MATSSPALNQHFAEKGEITILPNFRLVKPLRVLSCAHKLGPFLPQTPISVPLWLALLLKKQNKCKIIVPDWLSPQSLLEQRRVERELGLEEYAPIAHFHYRETASLLLKHAADDFEDSDLVRSLLEDVDNLRNVKIRSGLKKVASTQAETLRVERALNLTDLSALELVEFRPFLTTGMDMFAKIGAASSSSTSADDYANDSYYSSSNTTAAAAADSSSGVLDGGAMRPVKKLRRFR